MRNSKPLGGATRRNSLQVPGRNLQPWRASNSSLQGSGPPVDRTKDDVRFEYDSGFITPGVYRIVILVKRAAANALPVIFIRPGGQLQYFFAAAFYQLFKNSCSIRIGRVIQDKG